MQKKTIWDLNRLDPEAFRQAEKRPLRVVLDNIRSLNNIGSIFRTADAFAIDGLELCGITATPPSAQIHKTALGAEQTVAWRHTESTLDALAALKAEGYTLLCLEQVFDSMPLQQFKPEPGRKYALVAGHEVNGVSPEVVEACDICLEIPQFGTKHSLNVAVSVGIALWQMVNL